MHLPMLFGGDGMITNLKGANVEVFINGEKADDIDISTFVTKDVKRVQYIERPVDPQYEGLPAVVNFIVTKYEFGGVTRVDLKQKLDKGDYSVASKFVYKKMSYGALASVGYLHDHTLRREEETSYKDFYYDGTLYDEITRREQWHGYERNNKYAVAFNAKYGGEKFNAVHTLSIGVAKDPGSGGSSLNEWNRNFFGSDSAAMSSSSKSVTPAISGKYNMSFSDKWRLSGNWKVTYSNNRDYASNRLGEAMPVENWVNEDVTSLTVGLSPAFTLSDVWSFRFKMQSGFDWFSSKYRGSAGDAIKQSRQELTTSLGAFYIPSEKLYIYLEPGFSSNLWQVGDVSESVFYPIIDAYIGWNPNRKFSFDVSSYFFLFPASASQSNPVLVKNSDLLWSKGNPHLAAYASWTISANAGWIVNDWLSATLMASYSYSDNDIVNIYSPASVEDGGLVRELINAGRYDSWQLSMRGRGSFFNNSLSLEVLPRVIYAKSWYPCLNDMFDFKFIAGADYRFGNCQVGLHYDGPHKFLLAGGMDKNGQEGSLNFSFVYGVGNFYFRFGFDNVLNSRNRYWRTYSSPYFESATNNSKRGRNINVSLTYTIGYGKKVDNRIDIDSSVSSKTSILDSK